MCDRDESKSDEKSIFALKWKERIEIGGKTWIHEDLRISIFDYDIRIWKIKPNGRILYFLAEINTYPKLPMDCIKFG